MKLPHSVEIVDVAPRDGLQMLARVVATDDKVSLIEGLRRAGVRRIEATSFVNPQRLPQMADAEEVVRRVRADGGGVVGGGAELMALAVNEKGYERARAAGVDWVCFVVCATEEMSRRNANLTVKESLAQWRKVAARARLDKLKVRGSLAVAFVCPYEGDVPAERALDIIGEMSNAGADEVALNDTIGRAHPRQVYELCEAAGTLYPELKLAGHFHDTQSMALANIFAAMQAGVAIFDAAVGGLGGCPFSPGASGNVATEKVVQMLHRMGIATGIDETELQCCAGQASRLTIEETPLVISNRGCQ